MAEDRRRKYPKGEAPWELEGIPQSTWRYRDRKGREAEAGDAPAAPEPVEAPVAAAPAPAAPKPAPVEAPAKPVTSARAAPIATVNISLRSRVDQHDRLRAMAFSTRRSIQDLVSTAVDEFLARHE